MTRPALQVVIDGEPVRVPTEPRCKTCRSAHRAEAERLLVAGVGPTEVARQLKGSGLSADSLGEHQRRGHLAVELPAVRRAAQEAAGAAQEVTEEGVEVLADSLRLHRLVAARAANRIAAGRAEPTVSDGLAAERMIHEVEARAGNVDHEAWVTAMCRMLEIVEEEVTREQWMRIGKRGSADPLLRGTLTGGAS